MDENNQEEQNKKPPELTPERVREEIKRARAEIAYDLEKLKPDANILARTLQRIINT